MSLTQIIHRRGMVVIATSVTMMVLEALDARGHFWSRASFYS